MQIKIQKSFLDTALSPVPFNQNEFVTMPDDVAKTLVKRGLAIDVRKLKIETR